MTPPQTFRIERPGQLDLEFEGERLSHQSSHEEGKIHWTEIIVSKTVTGKYVIEVIGKSTIRGQKEKRQVRVVSDPSRIRTALAELPGAGGITAQGEPYLTNLALDVLDEAGSKDPAVKASSVERI